jgi:hypothetical protein
LAVIPFEMAPTQHGTTFGEEFTSVGGEQIMIQPLRSAHRRTWLALAPVLPMVLIVGLMAKRPLSRSDSKINNSEAGQAIWQSDDLWTKHKIHSAVLRDTSDPTSVQIVLESPGDLSVPDVLVYWAPQLPGSDSLPTNAVLLGVLENSRPLHLRDSNPKGFLILYSLAHHSIVDAAPLESVL